MKYRRNKVKREHGLIQNALPWLENLSHLSEVTDIIPGVINVSHSSERRIIYKYKTRTGCKILLKSNGLIQEVFIVTKNPECVEEWVKTLFSPDSDLPVNRSENPENKPPLSKKKLSNGIPNSKSGSENKPVKTSIGVQVFTKKRPSGGVTNKITEERNMKLGDQLDKATQKALKHLKGTLENSKRKTMLEKKQNTGKTANGKRP